MKADINKINLSIEIMMYGHICVEIEHEDSTYIKINTASDGSQCKEFSFSLNSTNYQMFTEQIANILNPLNFIDGVCELYDSDDGINWTLDVYSSNQFSIISSEKSLLLSSIAKIIEENFSINNMISDFLNM